MQQARLHLGRGPWGDSWLTDPISALAHRLPHCICGRTSGAPRPEHSQAPDASAAPQLAAWDTWAQQHFQAQLQLQASYFARLYCVPTKPVTLNHNDRLSVRAANARSAPCMMSAG